MSIAQVNPFGNQSYQNYDMFTKSKKDSSDAETEKPDISEVMKKYQEAHEITAQKLREDTDWRDMTDEEWDKILEGMDQYIDAFKERLKLQEELQEEAAKKAAAEADSAMKTTAASAAALNVAAGGSGDVVAGSGDERNEVSTGEEVKHEKTGRNCCKRMIRRFFVLQNAHRRWKAWQCQSIRKSCLPGKRQVA